MVIKDEHIKEASKLLIGDKEFNEERKAFIKNLYSCDLLAVPGSGKTTALLAKLYCLAKHLPFKDGSGILVLSHTNAAVNEIEKNLKKVVPILFEYPNFVGTVQSFVNKFLANPACFLKYGSYISIVDDDIANKLIINQTKKLGFNSPLSKYFFFQTFNQFALVTKKKLTKDYELTDVEAKNLISRLKHLGVIRKGSLVYSKTKNSNEIKRLLLNQKSEKIVEDIATKAKQWTDKEKNKRGILYTLNFIDNKFSYSQPITFESNSGKILLELYQNIFSDGIARYRDCYSLGFWLLHKYPKVKALLQKRFKYVFIDEMQDLEKYQIDIIDKIFYTAESPSIIQRIGDINQSIYNSGKKVKIEADWKPRKPIMYLKDSYRLTKENAVVVNFFTLDRQQDENGNPRFVVNGKRELVNAIKPHLILFDKTTKGKLKEKFKELIKENQLDQTVEGKKYGFKIIGWSAKWEDEENHEGKLRLEDIFEEYKKDSSSIKETYNSLSEYLQYFDKNKTTLEAARKAVLNALIHILRIEDIKHSVRIRGDEKEKYYTKKDLIKYIQEEKNGSNYENFKSKLYKWSFDLAVKQKHEEVYHSIKDFINSDFKEWFGFEITNETQNFIGRNFEKLIQVEDKQENKQIEGINIEIGTVHSVKGQTHCATMYVETSYINYETEKKRIKEALKKEEHNFNLRNNSDKRGKQAFKMIYVGFSRPTHLLCFAVLKENVKDKIENYKNAGWEIVHLIEKDNM